MAKYPAVITTMAGTNTIAEANASKQALIFTKIVIGAGDMPASIPRATALTDKRLELVITKSVKTGDGQFMVQGLLSNKNLEAGFYAREIGLMAKAGENGQEVLFSYTNGGNYVDYIPDKNTPMDSYTFTITTVVGNAEKVQAIISDNGVASVHDLEAHNSDEQAHGNLFSSIINKVKNMITSTDDDDKQDKAPSLSLVKSLLSKFTIKNSKDVVKAIIAETLASAGVRYDFSNTSAWYICLGVLFGGLIIQGGRKLNLTIYDGKKYDVQFPISYTKECIGVLQTLEWPTAIGGASVAYTDKRTTTGYTIVADASSAAYNSDLFYVAFGI